MIKNIAIVVFILLMSFLLRHNSFSQTVSSLPIQMLRTLENQSELDRIRNSYLDQPLPVSDLIVGFLDPNEVRDINTPMNIYGNIIVVNNGQLRFNNTQTHLQGNIILMHNGKLEINGGKFTVDQHYMYENSALVVNKASLKFQNTEIRFNGFSFSCGLVDTTSLNIQSSQFTNGVMTTAAMRHASVNAIAAITVGEYLFFDNSQGNFENCDGMLTWFLAPPQSDIDITYPSNNVNGLYIFPDSARTAKGIGYKISYATCQNTSWGLMTYTGSKVQVTNSTLLACGSIFQGTGQVLVENLVNKTHYDSFQYPATDRDVHFTNTTINVWNLYPSDAVQLTLQNSIFGEIISQNKSSVLVSNSFCDGTGGYVGSADSSKMIIAQSQLLPQVIARNNSLMILSLCNIPNSSLIVSDRSSMAIINTSFSSLPLVTTNSVAIIGAIDEPSSGFVGQKLRVYGSARLIKGSSVPAFLNSFWLDYRSAIQPNNWIRITQQKTGERYRDTLTTWDTKNILSGDYVLRLNLQLYSGTTPVDTIRVERAVKLLDAPVVVQNQNTPTDFYLGQNYPNPFSQQTTITLTSTLSQWERVSEGRVRVSFKVYDIFGREVLDLSDQLIQNSSIVIRNSDLPSTGIYYYRFTIGKNSQTRLMTLIK